MITQSFDHCTPTPSENDLSAMLKMASRTYVEKISAKTGEKITISFLQYFITEIYSFFENYPNNVAFPRQNLKTFDHLANFYDSDEKFLFTIKENFKSAFCIPWSYNVPPHWSS